jgi:hypothetical protein
MPLSFLTGTLGERVSENEKQEATQSLASLTNNVAI